MQNRWSWLFMFLCNGHFYLLPGSFNDIHIYVVYYQAIKILRNIFSTHQLSPHMVARHFSLLLCSCYCIKNNINIGKIKNSSVKSVVKGLLF